MVGTDCSFFRCARCGAFVAFFTNIAEQARSINRVCAIIYEYSCGGQLAPIDDSHKPTLDTVAALLESAAEGVRVCLQY